MDVKAADVKALRERTGAGMMDCKKAIIEAGGDSEKAEKILRELGLAAAAKRSGKAANEGRVFTKVRDADAGLLELSCETDFVARNEDFNNAGANMLQVVLDKSLKQADDEINHLVDDLRSAIKENISLKRFDTLPVGENDLVVDYIHGEGKIGVLVKLTTDSAQTASNDQVKEFAFDCALHVAAFNPVFLNRDSVDPKYLEEQQAIFKKQAESLDKPEKVLEGIAKGKLNKHLGDVVFVEQGFVKEEKTKVADVAKRIAKEVGGTIEIAEYKYFRVGDDA